MYFCIFFEIFYMEPDIFRQMNFTYTKTALKAAFNTLNLTKLLNFLTVQGVSDICHQIWIFLLDSNEHSFQIYKFIII